MSRERLTITLADAIIKKVDSVVDGQSIRNRSHAIEFILSKFFLSKVTKVVILAGGAGVHMRPLTYEMPKALVPVNGEPLMGHTVRALEAVGLEDIVVVVGTLGDKIEKHFEDGTNYSAHITYIRDKEESGTAQACRAVRGAVGEEPFMLIYGDVLANLDWLDFIGAHHMHNGLVTMAVTSASDTEHWGVLSMDGARVTHFTEKPSAGHAPSYLINAGIYIMHPGVLDRITPEMKSLEEELLPALAQEGELYGYHFSGKWFDVSTPAAYERAIREWKA